MKHHLFLKSACVAAAFILPPSIFASEPDAPKLVVQITVDQFRSDYLTRFAPALDQGFARILKGGTNDIEGDVDHAITNSAPGHASLATGSYPSTHGYSANEWWDYLDGKWQWVDGAVDTNTLVLGSGQQEGYSPINMKVSTLGEWITKTNKQSKSISVGASEVTVLYAGKTAEHAYWYDREAGRFITSTYFREEYPAWVDDFNEKNLPEYKSENWNLAVPEHHLKLADKDDQSFEDFGENYTFPHKFEDEYDTDSERSRQKQLDYWFYETPMADSAAFSLAKIAITAEQLGQRGHTDYLSIALGATDNIGHIYGGYSLEILDTMIRVDRELMGLIDFLNQAVGEGNYIIAVSGDHGAPDPIERTLQKGGDAYRIPTPEIDALLDRVDQLGDTHIGTRQELTAKIESLLESEHFVEDAVTEAEALGGRPSENPFVHLYRKSWVKGRIPDFPLWTSKPNRLHHPARYGIFVQYKKNTHFSYGMVVHGSPYEYDRKVPILMYGKGIPAQKVDSLRTIDIAPTLAQLSGIPLPGYIDGTALFKPAE